jgi:hypothetical protein
MFEEVMIGEQVAGEAEKLRKDVEQLIGSLNRSTFDIAEILFKIKTKGYYKGYGFNTFMEFISGLDIKTRKIQYLVRIVDILDQLNIPREEYEPIGIAKLREITSVDLIDSEGDPALFEDEDGGTHIVSDLIRGLLIKAPEMSLEEIKDYVRILKGFSGDNATTWLNICVNKQALEQTIQPALNLSKKILGTAKVDEEGIAQDYSDGKALEMICVDYLLDPANTHIGQNG